MPTCLPTLAFLFVVVASSAAGPTSADEPAEIPADRVIGSVYGKPVTAEDVGLTAAVDVSRKFDSRDQPMWDQMARIQRSLGGPILERFVKDRKLEATAEEIKAFNARMRQLNDRNVREWKAKLAEIEKQLAAADLPADDRTKLEKERKMYGRVLEATQDKEDRKFDELARMFIVTWKTERELHRQYGGRIIFQQAGLEALDGRRKLFEEAEKAGELKFDDAGVRHLFYYYANMHHTITDDKQALEKPWFLAEPQ